MGLLQQPLQRKLSKLLGAEVTFERLNVSLLGGSVEAQGMTVAGDDPTRPVLTVRRLRAEISVPRALKKEIVVRSLTIERPVLSVVRRADGTTNLPKPMGLAEEQTAGDGPAPTPAAPAPVTGDDEPDLPGAWKLEAQKVLVVDGEVSFRGEAPAGGGADLQFVAERILGELKSAGGGMDFTCIVESAGRREPTAEIGQVRFVGRAEGVTDLSQWQSAVVTASVDVGETLHAELKAPSLRPGSLEATGRANGAIDFSQLLPFLPAGLLPVVPSGKVQLDLHATYDAGRGLRVPELVVRGADLSFVAPLPGGTIR